MAIILVVDDEVGIRELLSEILIDEGYDVRLAENAAAAREQRQALRPDLVLLDIWMPDLDGISLLKEWHAGGQLTMPVVMMSGHGTIDTAVEATRFGAVDFLEKPISLQKLLSTVQKALRHVVPAQKTTMTLDAFGRSAYVREFRRRLEQAASKSVSVLLKGATPALAELCARTVLPPRAPWLDVSTVSSALTQEMLDKLSGGVLFVPDLAALGKMQQMNLAFAWDRLARGNIQLIAGVTQPLSRLQEQHWDPKLLHRIAEVWLAMPPLQGLADEIPELASVILNFWVERNEVPARRFSTAALNHLRRLSWQAESDGQWAELFALVRNLALTALEEEISEADVDRILPPAPVENATVATLLPLFELPLREARDVFEKMYFEHHLAQESSNMTRLAERSGLERTHLYRKLKQLGVSTHRRTED